MTQYLCLNNRSKGECIMSKTYDLTQGWFAVTSDFGTKIESMVLSNGKETIALGSSSIQTLREIFQKAGVWKDIK